MLALNARRGDFAVRTDLNAPEGQTWYLNGDDASNLYDWFLMPGGNPIGDESWEHVVSPTEPPIGPEGILLAQPGRGPPDVGVQSSVRPRFADRRRSFHQPADQPPAAGVQRAQEAVGAWVSSRRGNHWPGRSHHHRARYGVVVLHDRYSASDEALPATGCAMATWCSPPPRARPTWDASPVVPSTSAPPTSARNLRRTVDWLNDTRPVPFAKLPDPLPAKLHNQSDVVNLTGNLAAVEALLHDLDIDVESRRRLHGNRSSSGRSALNWPMSPTRWPSRRSRRTRTAALPAASPRRNSRT